MKLNGFAVSMWIATGLVAFGSTGNILTTCKWVGGVMAFSLVMEVIFAFADRYVKKAEARRKGGRGY